MDTLYYLPGSINSERAKDLLDSNPNIIAVAADHRLLAALWRDLGIGELPTVVSGNVVVTGLSEITERYST